MAWRQLRPDRSAHLALHLDVLNRAVNCVDPSLVGSWSRRRLGLLLAGPGAEPEVGGEALVYDLEGSLSSPLPPTLGFGRLRPQVLVGGSCLAAGLQASLQLILDLRGIDQDPSLNYNVISDLILGAHHTSQR